MTLSRPKRLERILRLSSMMPNKGVLHLLRVAAALRASGDVQVRLFLVGVSGPRLFMATLRRLHEQLGLEDTVVFTGSLPDDRLAAHYATADLFVCLSEHEGFCVPLDEGVQREFPSGSVGVWGRLRDASPAIGA